MWKLYSVKNVKGVFFHTFTSDVADKDGFISRRWGSFINIKQLSAEEAEKFQNKVEEIERE